MNKRLWWVLALVTVFLISSAAVAAGAAKRKRRKRPGQSSSEPADNGSSNSGSSSSGSSSSGSSGTSGKRPAASATSGKSLDGQIQEAQANIRRYRRAGADTVNAANLNGTMIFIPGGSAANKSVDWSSKHAGKTTRGKVRATGSGEKAPAEITGSRAK